MLARNSQAIFRRLVLNISPKQCRFNSTITGAAVESKDQEPYFFNNEVQKILEKLTRPEAQKVFRARKDGKKVEDPKYRFMTDEELQKELKKADLRAKKKLQMPPIVKVRDEIDTILSKDAELQGHDSSKYVFTDITFGVKNMDRLIVVRDIDGKLRKANWDERFRMNQIYFPVEGREMSTPKMFLGEHFEDVLKRQEYEFILDRACIQFEPDDPEYHRITDAVYEAVNAEIQFDKLRSTRHYGPLVFKLVWNQNIDQLLLENIQKGYIADAALLIKLLHKVHPSSKSADVKNDLDDLQLIQTYIELDSKMRGKLQATLEAYKELKDKKKEVNEAIQKAHGVVEK